MQPTEREEVQMVKESSNNGVDFVRLGSSQPKNQSQRIEQNKIYSRLMNQARSNTKRTTCYYCGEKCTSFCNSHSIPQFMLKRISPIASIIDRELDPTANDAGINNAGTFHIICNHCDNVIFKEYESPEAYTEVPSDSILAKIALKNYLQMMWKRMLENEYYIQLSKEPFCNPTMVASKLFWGNRDLESYEKAYLYSRATIEKHKRNRYHMCFYTKLNYVVPYATQAAITLLSDLEDGIINNIYLASANYHIENIHICVYPLKETSIVMAFVAHGCRRYSKFEKQLQKLTVDDQLATINYIVFSNTENVYMNRKLADKLQNDSTFKEICSLTGDYTIHAQNPDPLTQAINEFSLSRRTQIPNLLSKDYAL